MWKVMIADDEPLVREGLEKLIPWENLGCELIYAAEDGRQLLDQMSREIPDIVIVDICMPQVDGLEIAEYIFDKQLKTGVILLTAYADFHYAQKAIKYQVSDYIIKTSALEEIPMAVDRIRQRLEKEQMLCYRMVLIRLEKHVENMNQIFQYAFMPYEYRYMEQREKEAGLILSLRESHAREDILAVCEKLRDLCRNFLGEEPRILCSRVYEQWREQEDVYQELIDFAEECEGDEKHQGILIQPQFEDRVLDQNAAMDCIRKYIMKHYSEKITLAEIAEAVPFSPSYLSRFYKTKMGENLFDTINKLRIEKAKRLLEKHEKKIYEIADMTGFEDTAYFSKVFKKYTGCSPKEYQRRRRQQ